MVIKFRRNFRRKQLFRSRVLRQVLMVFLPFAGYAGILCLPQAGALGMVLRYRFDFSLILVGGILSLAFLPKRSLGFAAGLTAVLALFALPLAGLWSSAAGEMHVLGGMVFFSDTAGYLWDANRLLEGSLFSAFGARRPIFPGFLAWLLGITNHHLQASIAILVALCGIGCFLAAWELRKTHGPFAAAVFLVLLFLFYRRFIGMPDTENLGLALGSTAFALLWRGGRLRQRLPIFVGSFVLALAFMVRAGPFLVLLAPVAWSGLGFGDYLASFPGKRIKFSLALSGMVSLVMIMAVLLNLAVFKLTSDGRGSPFANYAYTLYGMAAGGKGWLQIYQDAPELAALPESEASAEITGMAVGLIRQNPGRLVHALLGQFADFFSLRDESVFGFASGADLVIFDSPRPENASLYRVIRLLLYGLSLVGLFWCVRQRTRLHNLLLFLCAGIILSVAFLPPRDSGLMRVYAAAMPFLVMLPAVGVFALLRWLDKPAARSPETQTGSGKVLAAYGLGLAVMVVAAPLLVRLLARPALLPPPTGCLRGEETRTVRISAGSYLMLVEDDIVSRSWLPAVRRSDFRASLAAFPHGADLAELDTIPAPALLQNAIDINTGQAFWLVLQGGQVRQRAAVVTLCGAWNPKYLRLNYPIFFGVIPEG